MAAESDATEFETTDDDAYFDAEARMHRSFDSRLLEAPISVLRVRTPLVFLRGDPVEQAMADMRRFHRGCVLVTEDGSQRSRLTGIFTERDLLLRMTGEDAGGRALEDVMTVDPETLPLDATVAWALNKMSLGGFRHVPVVDREGAPAFVVSMRDAVQFLVDAFPSQILNLPPEFGIPRYRTRDGA